VATAGRCRGVRAKVFRSAGGLPGAEFCPRQASIRTAWMGKGKGCMAAAEYLATPNCC